MCLRLQLPQVPEVELLQSQLFGIHASFQMLNGVLLSLDFTFPAAWWSSSHQERFMDACQRVSQADARSDQQQDLFGRR